MPESTMMFPLNISPCWFQKFSYETYISQNSHPQEDQMAEPAANPARHLGYVNSKPLVT